MAGMCRLCASLKHGLIAIDKSEEIREKLYTCCRLHIQDDDEDDMLPNTICPFCMDELNSFYKFYIRVQEAQETLQSFFSSQPKKRKLTEDLITQDGSSKELFSISSVESLADIKEEYVVPEAILIAGPDHEEDYGKLQAEDQNNKVRHKDPAIKIMTAKLNDFNAFWNSQMNAEENSVGNRQVDLNTQVAKSSTKKLYDMISLVSKLSDKRIESVNKKLDSTNNLVSRIADEVLQLKREINRISTNSNVDNANILPAQAFYDVEQFLKFDAEMKDPTNFEILIRDLMKVCATSSKDFVFKSWRTILEDSAARNLTWKGTQIKSSVQNLHCTAAIKEAYIRKYPQAMVDEFSDKSKKFFLYANDRLNKAEKYKSNKSSM